jgi:hypothetical protein
MPPIGSVFVISLHRISELGVPVAWHEAVAVAQAVAACAAQTERTLGPDNCFLSVEGTVELSGVPRMAWPNATLGTLQLLLKSTHAPAELLTLVRKSDGRSDTVISESLRFFARPDQMAVIKALATRAVQLDRELAAQDALEKLRENASSSNDSDRKKNDAARKHRLSRRAVAAVALGVSLGTVVLAGAWASRRGALGEAPLEAVSASASQVAQDLRTKVDSLVDSGLKSLGLSAGAPATNSTPTTAVTASPAKKRKRAPESRTTSSNVTPPPTAAIVAANTIADATAVYDTPTHAAAAVDDNMYSSVDVEVEPPALVRPQLPAPTERRGVNDATHIELHVNATGTVDRVRLYPDGSTLNDRMLVSAAKAWVFRPARKDGQPVKYTLLVPLTRP